MERGRQVSQEGKRLRNIEIVADRRTDQLTDGLPIIDQGFEGTEG